MTRYQILKKQGIEWVPKYAADNKLKTEVILKMLRDKSPTSTYRLITIKGD